ncbi:MAG: hypothetical protein P4L36_20130 [Holophaga sp.]|nr:hypothetical protein [Holophaga sp.]
MSKSDPNEGDARSGPSVPRLLLPACAAAAGLFLSPGCDRDQVSHATVAQEAPAAPGMASAHGGTMPPGAMPPGAMPPGTMPPGTMPPGGMPPGSMPPGQLPPPPHPTGKGALKWVLPKGWTETPGSGMRYATLTPPGAGKVEMSVVVLPGAAGGEPANVNRWRGQIGLPPLADEALASARKAVKSKAGTVAVYDFTSAGDTKTRMVTGLLASTDGNTWFFKLMGDAEPVAKAKPSFVKYLETLHLD